MPRPSLPSTGALACVALLIGAASAHAQEPTQAPDAAEVPPSGDGSGTSASAADGTSASAADGPWTLPLVLHGGFKGDFGLPDCRAEDGPSVARSSFARLATAATRSIAQAAEAGALPPVFLHTGDLAFPGALPSQLVARGAEDAASVLEHIGAIPYDAVALGGLDLSAPVTSLPTFFGAMAEREFPLIASNVTCSAEAPAAALCTATGTAPGATPYRIVARGPLRIAVIAVVDPAHTDEISAHKREGLTFAEVLDTVPPLVESIRAAGSADSVVLIAHMLGKAQEGALLRALPGIPGLDLVVLKQLGSGTWGKLDPPEGGAGSVGWSVAPTTGAIVVAAGRGVDEQVRAEIRIERSGAGYRWVATSAQIEDAAMYPPDDGAAAWVTSKTEAFCAAQGLAVREDFPLAGPMDEAGFSRWMLDVMRARAGTELSVINAGAVRNKELLPLRDGITYADLQSLLPFGGDLVRARIRGDDLFFLGGLLGSTALVGGLERVDGKLRVNGRPVDATRTYTVVMNRFVADGGDGLITERSLTRRRDVLDADGLPQDLVGLLEGALEDHLFADRKDGGLHPDRKFVDLHRVPRLRFWGSLNVAYSKVAVVNPDDDAGVAAYSKGELTGVSADTLYFDTRLGVTADSRDHEFTLSGLLFYNLAIYPPEFGGQLETGDTIRGSAVYQFVGLRALTGDKGYAPIPFGEIELQTEFDRPDTRDWHRLQGTAIAGVKLRPLRPLTFKVGANVRSELLDPDTDTLGGLFVGYSLDRFDLFSIAKQPVQFESNTDWFFNDIGRTDVHEIRHFTRLYFGLLDKLFFSATFSGYLYREKPVGAWGAYVDLTLGINVRLGGSVQTLPPVPRPPARRKTADRAGA